MRNIRAKTPSPQLHLQLSRNRATELLREIERLDGESKRLIEQSERMTELCDSIHRELEKFCALA